MTFKHLHAPDGHQVGINPDHVVSVRPAEQGLYDKRAHSVVIETNGFQAVRETEAEAEKELEK